jgi:hypothetical protein
MSPKELRKAMATGEKSHSVESEPRKGPQARQHRGPHAGGF